MYLCGGFFFHYCCYFGHFLEITNYQLRNLMYLLVLLIKLVFHHLQAMRRAAAHAL